MIAVELTSTLDRTTMTTDTDTQRLGDTQRIWEALAQSDPLWAVLSEPEKKGRRWAVDEFMATGEVFVRSSLARFETLGGTLRDRRAAVDFGCGVGRLTQPLARRFDRAIGIDISPTMVQVARRLNMCGRRARYIVNDQPDLGFIPDRSVSLVLSHITLQHLPPDVAKGYMREFARIVDTGGGLIFQVPSHLTDAYLPADDRGESVPPEARLAQIAADVPTKVEVGQTHPLRVSVRNVSDQTWRQTAMYPLNIGNHWLDSDGRAAVSNDDGRVRLPVELQPGDAAELVLLVRPPMARGFYHLQIDVVQEGVSWFASCGSMPLDRVVEVVGAPPPQYEGGKFHDLIRTQDDETPMFDMHGVPYAEVEKILTECGCVLLGVEEHVTEWQSFTYYAQVSD